MSLVYVLLYRSLPVSLSLVCEIDGTAHNMTKDAIVIDSMEYKLVLRYQLEYFKVQALL